MWFGIIKIGLRYPTVSESENRSYMFDGIRDVSAATKLWQQFFIMYIHVALYKS